MKLRTQILLFFFIFALTPLMLAVVINLPLVLERMELFYQKAHLQNLRADFRDLDQHLASRNEMIRLLAKLPEPGTVLGIKPDSDKRAIDQARARYIDWTNQIFRDQLDIVEIVFYDESAKERFWLERHQNSGAWHPTTEQPSRPSNEFISSALKMEPGRVLVSAISIDEDAGSKDVRRLMTLWLISSIYNPETNKSIGTVSMSIDVGGMAHAYHNTLWLHANGDFLKNPNPGAPTGNAFSIYPGLKHLFAQNKPVLWKGDGKQVMWVPMFRTEQEEALWVGRPVDSSPIAQFRQALTIRVLSIIFLLMIATWLAARWIAKRISQASTQLTSGIQHILENDESVAFNWKGPQELKQLGNHLSTLAAEHAQNSKNLRAHAQELEQSNKYKSQFLANISHELKTPLNSILLLSKLLGESSASLPEEDKKKVRVIHHAASDLQGLIDNILDLSRIEAGKTPLHLRPVDLQQHLKDVVSMIKPQFEEKGLTLELDILSQAPESCNTDPEKLAQIVKNFLSNAVKFTEKGGARVTLGAMTTEQHADEGLFIAVTDTGIGIPITQQGQIFEAFKQADGSTSRRFGGTGLGLSISQQLAELLGGYIELESAPEKGSTFTFYMPISCSEPKPREPRAPAAPESPQSTDLEAAEIRFDKQHILIVDHDVQHLLKLTPLLEQANLQLTAAGDCDEAMEVLEDEQPNLILADVPDSDESHRSMVSTLHQHSDIPIVALGETDDEALKHRIKEAGALEYLARPFSDADLLQCLASNLKNEDAD